MDKREMKINVVKKWLRNCSTWECTTYGNISEQKFSNACRAYAGNIAFDDVIGLIDTTVFGSGKKGMMFTIDRVYFSSWEGGKYFDYKNPVTIDRVEYNCTALNELIKKLSNIEIYGTEEEPSGWDILGGIIDGVSNLINEVSNSSKEIEEQKNTQQQEENEKPEIAIFGLYYLLGKISKIDGPVTKDQIELVQGMMDSVFGDEKEYKDYAIKCFKEAKDSPKSFEDYCKWYYEETKNMEDVEQGYMLAIYSLYSVAYVRNEVISNEAREKIQFATELFNLSQDSVKEIRDEFINPKEDEYYLILGCKKGDSFDVIRKKYRELAAQYHPDVLASKDVPQYILEYSTQKFQELQEAYEYIKNSFEDSDFGL